MNYKRGQVSIYIILGIIILVGIGFLLSQEDGTIAISQTDVRSVEYFMQSCYDSATTDALGKLGMYGGFSEIHTPVTFDSFEFNMVREIPSKEDLQNNLAKLVVAELQECTFISQEFEVEFSAPIASVLIEDTVSISLEWDATVVDESSETKVSLNQAKNLNVRLRHILATAQEIVSFIQETGYIDPLGAMKYDVSVDVTTLEGGSQLFLLTDKTMESQTPFGFSFAVGVDNE